MRYYLDTNILIFTLLHDNDNINREISCLFDDYSNLFHVSTVAIRELIHLHKTGSIKDPYYKTTNDLLETIERSNIQIQPLNKYHLLQYAKLEIMKDHKDPNDHAIIAQAISDRIPLISSDSKFHLYTNQGLKFVFNRR